MNFLNKAILSSLLVLFVTACGGKSVPTDKIKGSFTYRERIALPPDSYADIKLMDITNGSGQADVIVEQKIDLTDKSVPIDFTLSVPKNTLQSDHDYTISVQIINKMGHAKWSTDRQHPVDPNVGDQTLKPFILARLYTD